MAKCTVCGEREATLRDRNNPTSRRKTLCKECHRERLKNDLKVILNSRWKR